MKHLSPLALALACATLAHANDIRVENVGLANQDVGAGTTEITFDIGWSNSWRLSIGPANYDAAWVFAKFRVGSGPWQHATVLTSGSAAPAGATLDVYDDRAAMLYRDADGSGDVDWDDVVLTWDYDADGVAATDIVDVEVFAIEMVYVPEGGFSLGTVNSDRPNQNNEFYRAGFIVSSPYEVTGEEAITIGTSFGNLYYLQEVGDAGDQLGPVPAGYPKGFAAYYCMKYEVTQAQWVAFFNTLTPAQKVTRDITGPNGKNSDDEFVRNAVAWPDVGDATTTLPDVAMNYIASEGAMAYLDWAALRPMTELEFEKSARGPLAPVAGEFAWGTAQIYGMAYDVLAEGTPDERVANPGTGVGNTRYLETNGTPSGPLRVGALAASAVNQTREETGGSYYGIMDVSGNVYERLITVGNPTGRAFTGEHGDGSLAGSGDADVAGWPTADEGIGYRGGSYANPSQYLRVADRNDAANSFSGSNGRIGLRGVRTAQ